MSDSNRGKRLKALANIIRAPLGIALACLLVGFFSYLEGRQSEGRENRSYEYAEAAKANAIIRCQDAAPAAIADCVYNEIDSSQEQAQAEQDLDAQQKMARWALLLTFITLGTLGVSWRALVYLRDTFEKTAAGAEAAQISADAYIWNERARLKQIEPVAGRPTPLPRDIFPQVRIQNIGKSVAEIVSVNAQQIGDNQRKIGNSIEWGSAGRIVEPDKDVTLRGLPVTMNAGDIIMFQVGVKYRVLGGAEDTLDCTCRVIVNGMPDSVGKHGVTLSK